MRNREELEEQIFDMEGVISDLENDALSPKPQLLENLKERLVILRRELEELNKRYKVMYRIIKFEGTPERVDEQLMKSVLDNIVCEMPDLTISIKDRNDDPNERGFFESCRRVSGMVSKGLALTLNEKEYLVKAK